MLGGAIVSLGKNVVANYISQLYMAGIGIIVLPLYIKSLGPEAYGLIGFYTMLQAWFGLLDLGLTPTIGRETARYHGGTMSAVQYRRLFRILNMIFLSVAITGGITLFYLSDQIVRSWLTVEIISLDVVIVSVEVMAVIVALRWMTGLYRGVITGSERLVWLSKVNIFVATSRALAVFVTMEIFGYTVDVFFIHQLAVAVLEFLLLLGVTRRLLPNIGKSDNDDIGWSFRPVLPLLRFSLSVAFTSSIWVMITQVDKLILSGVLKLEEYGYFSLAVMLATGILTLSTPVSSAIMPRMARLFAERKSAEMISVYRNTTQVVSVLAGTASVFLAVYSERILFVWTGDSVVAENTSTVLRLYAIGYGVLAVAAFPYYLQYAIGNLKYHLWGNVGVLVLLLPAMVWASKHYGSEGAGYAWLTIHLLYFIFWVSFIHKKFIPHVHMRWLMQDIFKIYLFATLASVPFYFMISELEVRVNLLLGLMTSGFVMLLAAVFASDYLRKILLERITSNG